MSLVPTKRRRKSTKPSPDTAPSTFRRPSQHQQHHQSNYTDMDVDASTTADTTSAPPPTPQPLPPLAPFLSLPLEIRRQIYSHLLLAPPTHPILWPSAPSTKPQRTIHPSILLANRQINHEATSLLYTHNRFSFHHPSDCNIFSHIFAQPFAHHLSSIVFRMRDRPSDVALWTGYFGNVEGVRGLRVDMPWLSQVLVFVSQGWPGGGGLDPREAYEKWIRGYALRELIASLDDVAQGMAGPSFSQHDDNDIDQPHAHTEQARNSSRMSIDQSRNSSRTSREDRTPCDVCIVSSIRVGERVWDSLVTGLAGEGGVVTECPRGVLRGTVAGTVDKAVRVCLEIVCVGRERERG